MDKEIIKETKLSRVRLLWRLDLSTEKTRFDNQQFTYIHLSTTDNLKEFRDIFGNFICVGVKKAKRSNIRLSLSHFDNIQVIDPRYVPNNNTDDRNYLHMRYDHVASKLFIRCNFNQNYV